MNLNLIALFSLGAFFSFLSYLVTTLEDKGINKQNYKAVLLVLFLCVINSMTHVKYQEINKKIEKTIK